MAVKSSLPFMPWSFTSRSIGKESSVQRKVSCCGSPQGHLPCAVHDVAQAKACGSVLPGFQEAFCGIDRCSTARAMALSSSQVSQSNILRGFKSFWNRGRTEFESISNRDSQTLGSFALGSEAPTADEQQNVSQASPCGDLRNRKECRDWEQGLWSIVIPTYNRLPILSKCLQALEEQSDYSLAGIISYEVIVVDDGSTDGTVGFLRNGDNNARTSAQCEYPESKGRDLYSASSDMRGSAITTGSGGGEDMELGRGARSRLEPATSMNFRDSAILQQSKRFPHVKFVQQKHGGATKARNLGLKYANGTVIVFIDSDLIVSETFLRAHGEALRDAFLEDGDDRAFTYGRVVDTSNFHDPKSEKVKLTDYSAAFFATGNVAISHKRLLEAGKLLGCNADGPFDSEFSGYGWEDLELGVRLRQCGTRIKHAPAAVGYHWHPAFCVEQLPTLIEKERQRGRSGVRFYHKHPTFNVRLMIQMTPFHEFLWFLLTLGGLVNESSLEPILRWLVVAGRQRTAAALVSPILNWHTVQAMKEEVRLNGR